MRPGHEDRIAHLFKRGHSLDLIAELGLLYGWTRADALKVLRTKGWAMDWSGRLQQRFLAEPMPLGVPVAKADPERLLNAGIDHEVPEIRKAAMSAERAIEKLRNALMIQEARDAELAAQTQDATDVLSRAFGIVLGAEAMDGDVRTS